jgi:hypothetical protein
VKLLLGALAVVAALAAPGCGPSCQPVDRVVADGVRDLDGPVRTFQTSTPDGPLLPFEGGTMLRIRHGLGIRPELVQVTLSFTERPMEAYKGGSSQAAGNQAIVLRQDADEVAVKNDSCANYFVRVVVVGYTPDDAGVADTSVTDATVDGG